MNINFFIFLLIIVILRATFYRIPGSKSITHYVILGGAGVALLFVLFSMNPVMSWMTPALLLLLALFQWSTETQFRLVEKHSARLDGVIRFIHFVVLFVTLAVVFSSSRAPLLRDFVLTAHRYIDRDMLVMTTIGAIVTFEADHLIREPVATPVRLLVFIAVLMEAYLAAAVIAVGSIITLFFADTDRTDRMRVAGNHFTSIALSVVGAIVTLVLVS